MTVSPLIPVGISHEVDLSGMTLGQRMKHHTRELRRIAKWQGIDGVNAYKARWPEAADILIGSEPRAYVRKPSGYKPAILALVALWFDSGTALASSNREDVARLNAKLGTDFDHDRFFSRTLSPSLRSSISELFAQRGAYLDPGIVKSMSQVRQAIRSKKASAAPEGRPFAGIGTRTPQSLTIGTRSFRIEQHKGRECIRVTHDGTTQRFYLGNLQELLSGLVGEQAGASPPPTICIYTGELVPSAETDSAEGHTATSGTSSPSRSHILESGKLSPPHISEADSGEIVPPLTRADLERMAADRLSAAHAEAEAAGCDILEI